MLMVTALLIPSYEPKTRVAAFLSQFQKEDFSYFLVVDDGSGEKYDEVFDAIQEQTVFDVIRYPVNKGKGNALKTGLRHLLQNHPDLDLIVTADSDGQHLRKDILEVKKSCESHTKSLVLGVRDFSKAPGKSQSGNLWGARYFKAVSGASIKDTQTGLRGIPSCLFDLFLKTKGTRFEFEMRFLLDASCVVPIEQVDIETVYEQENEGSHFRPLKDSLRIAGGLINYAIGLTIFIILDIVLFAVLRANAFNAVGDAAALDILYCNLISVFGTGLLVYIILQQFAFCNRVFFLKSLVKTLLVLTLLTGLQYLCTVGLSAYYGWSIAVVVLMAHVIVCIKAALDYRFVFAMKKIK